MMMDEICGNGKLSGAAYVDSVEGSEILGHVTLVQNGRLWHWQGVFRSMAEGSQAARSLSA